MSVTSSIYTLFTFVVVQRRLLVTLVLLGLPENEKIAAHSFLESNLNILSHGRRKASTAMLRGMK